MKLYTSLSPERVTKTTGIGQVVLAQHKYFPKYGIEIVSSPENADLISCHVSAESLPRVDILHCHGLYWDDMPHANFDSWHHNANKAIVSTARGVFAVTVPSNWVSQPFLRDMRIKTFSIGHGIDLDEWDYNDNHAGYVLYNKNREGDVCRSIAAWELAQRGVSVVSTFKPKDSKQPESMRITGVIAYSEMKNLIKNASIYLATTPETFGIGTIEAMACGVPVLGYRWGGTEDIVRHGIDGYLVEPGNIDGLINGLSYITENMSKMRLAARERIESYYTWDKVIPRYIEVFDYCLEKIKDEKKATWSVVITNHNYEKWVVNAIESATKQTVPPKEIIVVDDGSKDSSVAVITKIAETNKLVTLLAQSNTGVAGARNNGIEKATSEFITCLDADDTLHPDFAQKLLPEIKKSRGMGVVYSGMEILYGDGTVKKSDWPPEFDWVVQTKPETPPSTCIPSPSGCIFRKEMWRRCGGYRQEYAPGEDAEFWTRGLSIGFTAKRALKEALWTYSLHGGSASNAKKYNRIDNDKPWMTDNVYPMAAPSTKVPKVFSYMTPGISVIIPVGAGHEYLVMNAINGIIGQTYRNWELIVIDDTKTGLIKLKEMYPFIKYLDGGGKGAGHARNVGIDASRAKLCFFLDADDYISPSALEEMLFGFSVNKEKYIYTDWISIEDGEIEEQLSKDYSQYEWKMQHPVSVLIETDKAKFLKFDENLESWEDWDFFIRCSISGFCGVRLAKPLLYYRTEIGTRRELVVDNNGNTNPLGEKILKSMREKYGEYYTGAKKMASCCGGNGANNPILLAKQHISGVRPIQDVTNDTVRMEYVGDNEGAITYTINGKNYRGGRNAVNRFTEARGGDVSKLEQTGNWVRLSVKTKDVGNMDATKTVTASALTQAQVMEMARRRLETAKATFEKQEPVILSTNVETPVKVEKEVKVSEEPHLKTNFRYNDSGEEKAKRGRPPKKTLTISA